MKFLRSGGVIKYTDKEYYVYYLSLGMIFYSFILITLIVENGNKIVLRIEDLNSYKNCSGNMFKKPFIFICVL